MVLFSVTAISYAQQRGALVAGQDGSVRFVAQVDAKFRLASDPGQVRVRVGKLEATTLEACMASTDFSGAVEMNKKLYRASYDHYYHVESFSFGVEREMKEGSGLNPSTCHVVRFDGEGNVDARDFLIWQRGFGTASFATGLVSRDGAIIRDRNSRQSYVKVLRSSGF